MKPLVFLILSGFLIGISATAYAQDATLSPEASQKVQQWQSMTPEQRQARKQEARQQFQNMTPEQRQAFKAEKKAQFDNLPSEKKEAIKARFAQRRAMRQQKVGQ